MKAVKKSEMPFAKTFEKPASRPKSPARRRLLKAGVAAALTGIAAPSYAYEIEPAFPEITRHDILLSGWPKTEAGLKIGQLSDFHCQDRRAAVRTERAVEMLLGEKPDIVFLTGDYITSGYPLEWAIVSANALAPLRNVPRGVFATLGNHDYSFGRSDLVAAALEQVGFRVLRNRPALLPGTKNVWIVGMESRSLGAEYPRDALKGVPDDAVKVLLIHEPDYADEAPLGFSLQLSGHSHAGQVRVPGLPPFYCPSFGRNYPEGLQQAHNHLVYTTRGVGMMGPQMRFCCPPEVTLLTIYPA